MDKSISTGGESCRPDSEKKARSGSGFSNQKNNWAKKWAQEVNKEMFEFEPLELYDAGGDMSINWYFVLYFRNPVTGDMERLKPTFNINRIHNKADRYTYASKVKKLINRKLKLGEINPFQQAKITEVSSKVLIDELRTINATHTKKMSDETKKSYTTYVNRLSDFLTENELEKIRPDQFTASHAQNFQLSLSEEKELANPTINSNIGRIRGYFDTLRKKRMIIVNPFTDVKSLPMRRSFKYVPFSEDEKKAIADKLRRESPSLYLLSQIIYNCFGRPKELCSLTRSDFDFSGEGKYLILKHDNIKNNRTSYRQIHRPLYDLLISMGIDRYPMNEKIFADIIGNSSVKEVQRKSVTYLWHKLIIEDLGINNNLYALKHTGNCDYIMTNPQYDILWLQQQNGHSSIEQTQKYIRDLPIRFLQESDVNVRLFGQ